MSSRCCRVSEHQEAFLAGVLAALMARSVEIEAPIVVLLRLWLAGAPIMKSNEKCQMIKAQKFFNTKWLIAAVAFTATVIRRRINT